MQLRTTAQEQLTFAREATFARALRWFMIPPTTVGVLLLIILAATVATYQGRHADRIYTGVSVWGTDLSMMTHAEAREALAQKLPVAENHEIRLVDPDSGQEWVQTAAELGVTYDVEETIEAAYNVGRDGGPFGSLRAQLSSWYYGRSLAPVIVFDEGQLQATLDEIAADVNRPARDASLQLDGETLSYTPGQVGRRLDVADAKERLTEPLTSFRPARVELLVHEVHPQILDEPETAARTQALLSAPMTFYFQEPLEDVDLGRVELSTEQLAEWVRVAMVEGENGYRHEVIVDEVAVRQWLEGIETQIFRRPENARFYFDDNTRELVLVEPHVNGRTLDVDATLERFIERVGTPNRSVPFAVKPITPTVHSNATAAELGITELITETTTWFYGSTPERKHNIARAAAQFFGIVVAPGEEFSFNRYLGDVTEEAGFTSGLIILDGQTVEGVGGGVCQVSTTMFQTAFWAGFPVTARQEHGYRVHYYDDGEGPGMDATVFSPIVDLKFVNNTEHHLLIENYYNETFQSLTFKFYSTRTGRRVEKEGPYFENVTPPTEDVWEYNENLEEGEIRQIDWAVEGADVTVIRRVYDRNGELMYGDETFNSHYIPWHNTYQYGPGVDPDNVSPADIPD